MDAGVTSLCGLYKDYKVYNTEVPNWPLALQTYVLAENTVYNTKIQRFVELLHIYSVLKVHKVCNTKIIHKV